MLKEYIKKKLFELVPYSGAKDVLFDRSGFMNMPLVNNGAIFQNNALCFNGSAKLRPKDGKVGFTMEDGTLSVWFTIETASTNYQMIYIDSVSKFAIGIVKSSNTIIPTCNGSSKTKFTGASIKYDGSINNIIVSYNTGKTPQFMLINGVSVGTNGSAVWTETSGLTIGNRMYNSAQSGFKGNLLKVGVYNRQFTQDEAVELYNSEKGMFLPDDYIQLEYIQSTGTQYIDTGINPKIKPRVVAKMAIINATDCDYWGNKAINGSAYYADFKSYNLMYYRYGSTTSQNVNYVVGANEIHVWDVSDNVYVDGSLKFTSTNTYTYSSSQGTIQIFKAARASYYSSYKLYNFKLYDGDELCRNFIPAKRKSDNVMGLYDLVSHKFFTNSGTGSFTGA